MCRQKNTLEKKIVVYAFWIFVHPLGGGTIFGSAISVVVFLLFGLKKRGLLILGTGLKLAYFPTRPLLIK